MEKKKIIFGVAVALSLVFVYVAGLWFGRVPQANAGCGSMWIAACTGPGCDPCLEEGFGAEFAFAAQSDNNYRIAICAAGVP